MKVTQPLAWVSFYCALDCPFLSYPPTQFHPFSPVFPHYSAVFLPGARCKVFWVTESSSPWSRGPCFTSFQSTLLAHVWQEALDLSVSYNYVQQPALLTASATASAAEWAPHRLPQPSSGATLFCGALTKLQRGLEVFGSREENKKKL